MLWSEKGHSSLGQAVLYVADPGGGENTNIKAIHLIFDPASGENTRVFAPTAPGPRTPRPRNCRPASQNGSPPATAIILRGPS